MNEHRIQVFISHSWNYSNHYNKLSEWIFEGKWNITGVPIVFIDKSIPKENPIHNAPNADALRTAIFREMNNSHVVVIPTGMYAEFSTWIQKEIEGARRYGRPILAVDPWGQERKSSTVVASSAKSVGWNKQSVVGGIWELYAKHYSG